MVPGIKKVAVIGTGTLELRSPSTPPTMGYEVSAYDPDETSLKRTIRLLRIRISNSSRKPTIPLREIQRQAGKVRMGRSIQEAVREADLVIEAIPEDLALKRIIFKQIDRYAPRKPSWRPTVLPSPLSQIEKATRRPEKCLNLHFYSSTWAEILPTSWGEQEPPSGPGSRQGLGPVHRVRPADGQKREPRFCFNRVWRAVKRECLHMWAGGYADFRTSTGAG